MEYFFKVGEGNLTNPQAYTDFTPAPALELQGTDFVANTSDLAAGENFTIYVRAFTENGTPSLYSSTTFALRTVTAILVTSIEATEIDCGEPATGSMTVNATGGEGTLQYSIDGENYSAANNFEGLAADEYILKAICRATWKAEKWG
ncbi:hypothetical protein [Pontibacter beigongshangensis]|uniref:hypothetical protein n=1 Tax=Pontibacter beigongshangensis TaxID=2574733 RepID=UPI00164F2E00|nr:hypothetical protein [Pontibacter beigongshangensis]